MDTSLVSAIDSSRVPLGSQAIRRVPLANRAANPDGEFLLVSRLPLPRDEPSPLVVAAFQSSV
jgi:hypothetical protein